MPVYWQILLSKSSFTLPKQLNTILQGIYSDCLSLFVSSNTTLLELQTLLILFFSKICTSKLGVRLI